MKSSTSGIYFLIAVAKESDFYGWVYAGLSTCLETRFTKHLSDLRKGRHGNAKLQHYWNKYGEGSLEYHILFECPIEHLSVMEKRIIANLDLIDNGLNILTGGERGFNPDSCIPVTLTNMKTHETKTAISIAEFSRLYGVALSSVSRLAKGSQNRSGDWYNPAFKWRPTYRTVIDPEGNERIFIDLAEFCKEHNLNHHNMMVLMRGESQHAEEGWTRPDSRRHKLHKRYELLDPEDNLVSGYNIRDLAVKTGLFYGSFSMLIRGKIDSYKGWRRTDNPNPYKKTYELVSPEGQLVEFTNITHFAKANNISLSMIMAILNGRAQQGKGWKLPNTIIQPRIDSVKFTLRDPNGKIHEGVNLKKFAEEMELNYKTLWGVAKGKKGSYKGWKLAKEKAEDCSSAS